MEKEDFNDKYKFLAEIAQNEYNFELTRSTKFDEKIGRQITLISVIIVAFTTMVVSSFFATILSKAPIFIGPFILINIFLLGVFLSGAWYQLYLASNFHNSSKFPIAAESIQNKVKSKDEIPAAAYWHIYLTYTNCINENRSSLKLRLDLIQKSQDLIKFSAIAFIFLLCFIFFVQLYLFLIQEGIK
ncbi:MAG: hypothetical protein ACK4GA_00335 [Acinetobacter sp.]|uniref:hypothetical protein n=1 Tax=Acinetobacter TaxID=469 RepID=UPI00189FAF42|nr:hypothetical protein [Acinetobacter lwoffii]QPF32055.1 hypothetical protein H0S56_13745 [Acinetobacter lwoffii]